MYTVYSTSMYTHCHVSGMDPGLKPLSQARKGKAGLEIWFLPHLFTLFSFFSVLQPKIPLQNSRLQLFFLKPFLFSSISRDFYFLPIFPYYFLIFLSHPSLLSLCHTHKKSVDCTNIQSVASHFTHASSSFSLRFFSFLRICISCTYCTVRTQKSEDLNKITSKSTSQSSN